ncbi:MAG TPA: four helix bundle protein [Candidatus Udaeobacter sp.]|jgi:four helix bundle protein|nr:four helix bundle protein [Candidatus Udaeobacter sp.]
MFNFETLGVWQKAIDFPGLIYNETQNFPSEERLALTNQLWRATVSISFNIAEGSFRSSKHDFVRFVEIAAGSVFEALSQASIARRQNFFSEDQFRKIHADAEELSRILSDLRRSLLLALNSQP